MGQIRFRLGIAALLAFAVLRFASPAMAADGSLDVPVKESEAADAPVTEKLHLYSAVEFLRFGAKTLVTGGRSLRSRADCQPWYDGRR